MPPTSRVFLPLLSVLMLTTVGLTQAPQAGRPARLPGLIADVQLSRDTNDIVHIDARNAHDLYFLQGYVHAQDRLFQMDVSRRQASGTLAELLGPAALASDVQLRTFGLRRAAAGSLAALSDDTRQALEAYADGVNAWVSKHALPPEYAALEITRIPEWTALDGVAVGKLIAFGLSFDLDDIDRTVALQSYTVALGGAAGQALFFEDVYRSQPFDPASTVPDASQSAASLVATSSKALAAVGVDNRAVGLARKYLDDTKDIEVLRQWRENHRHGGSNEWGVSGPFTEAGFPLLANDPHLALGTPATWYPIHLRAGSLDVIGNGFPGTPFVTLGHNKRVAWGATVNPMDVTDVFSEQVVPDAHSPSGLSTVHLGQLEPVMPIPEVFRTNQLDGIKDNIVVVPPGGNIPAATLIVPRRNNGPIISLDQQTGAALSVQYTGFSPTRELDAFRLFNEADDLADFRQALGFFDFGSQNFAYADVAGNIAHFTSAEMPVREDLQAGTVAGLPPYFIRNGSGGNEWLPVAHPQPNQAVPYEILPADEMPHIVNPPAGWFVNANNDPAGTTLDNNPLNQLRPGGGIYYLSPGYSQFRAGRVTQLIRERLASGRRISFGDMQRIQADTGLLDAQFFVPHILNAQNRGQAAGPGTPLNLLASQARIQEAVQRMAAWNFTTPTGIAEGYDARVSGGPALPPSAAQVANSVAATIYSVWRSEFIATTIDAVLGPLPKPPGDVTLSGLRHLLEQFPVNHGVGASGLQFFNGPGATAEDKRDFVILESLANALDLLKSAPMSAAFGGSSNQADYRWGKLHRIVFAHVLDSIFSIPPAGGAFPPPLAGLTGVPTDGGFETVDASTHDARARTVNAFMFKNGPSNRTVHEGRPGGMEGASSLPGGPSGTVGSPFYFNLLPQWLVNQAYPFLQRQSELQHNLMSVEKFVPAGS